jgi:hypothetical protein
MCESPSLLLQDYCITVWGLKTTTGWVSSEKAPLARWVYDVPLPATD